MTIKVFAPATVGNFIIGFDILGLAIVDDEQLGDIVSISPNQTLEYSQFGAYIEQLPPEKELNLAFKAIDLFHAKLTEKNIPQQDFKLTLEKRMPVGSGLGSSACSIVAAMVALNAFYQQALNNQELLILCGDLEGSISGSVHFDNVAPCLLGNLQLMLDNQAGLTQQVALPDHWQYVICHPGIQISTKEARNILPDHIGFARSIAWSQQLANLIQALNDKAPDTLLKPLLVDHLVEPHRQHLIPKFKETKATVLAQGALAFGISGSGPTMISICQNDSIAAAVAAEFSKTYGDNPKHFIHICQLDKRGARQL